MEKIRKYIEELFEHAPKTKEIKELQEELRSDLEEKYSELIRNGMKEKEAYEEVISGIGDIDELIQNVHPVITDKANEQKERQKTALFISGSIALYILSLVIAIIADEYGSSNMGGIFFLMIAGLATCLLVYRFISMPKPSQAEKTFHEGSHYRLKINKNKEVRHALSSVLWLLTTTVYFLVSFIFGIWYISWIIFLIAAFVESIIGLVFRLKEED